MRMNLVDAPGEGRIGSSLGRRQHFGELEVPRPIEPARTPKEQWPGVGKAYPDHRTVIERLVNHDLLAVKHISSIAPCLVHADGPGLHGARFIAVNLDRV